MTTIAVTVSKCSQEGCSEDAVCFHPFGYFCIDHFQDACARMRQPILDAGWDPQTFFATKTQEPDDPVLTEEVE